LNDHGAVSRENPRKRASGGGRDEQRSPSLSIEIRLPPADVGNRVEAMRQWLDVRRCIHTFISTGSSDERLVILEFSSDADAADFARQFSARFESI
jgi:hypothetical protein